VFESWAFASRLQLCSKLLRSAYYRTDRSQLAGGLIDKYSNTVIKNFTAFEVAADTECITALVDIGGRDVLVYHSSSRTLSFLGKPGNHGVVMMWVEIIMSSWMETARHALSYLPTWNNAWRMNAYSALMCVFLFFACYYVYLLYLLGYAVQRVQPSALKKTLAT
jgi:hypothetical protein